LLLVVGVNDSVVVLDIALVGKPIDEGHKGFHSTVIGRFLHLKKQIPKVLLFLHTHRFLNLKSLILNL
jgi:hypothetical protein